MKHLQSGCANQRCVIERRDLATASRPDMRNNKIPESDARVSLAPDGDVKGGVYFI